MCLDLLCLQPPSLESAVDASVAADQQFMRALVVSCVVELMECHCVSGGFVGGCVSLLQLLFDVQVDHELTRYR